MEFPAREAFKSAFADRNAAASGLLRSSPGWSGQFQGSASWIAQGKSRGALHLSGSGNVDIAAPVVDTSGDFTVSAWVRVNEPGGFQTFVSIDGVSVSGFYLQLRGDTGLFAFTMLKADAPRDGVVASGGPRPQLGAWYHLTGVHDAATKTIGLYINGILEQTAPFDGSWRATGHTEIGRGKFNGAPADFAKADIDEVRIDAVTSTFRLSRAKFAYTFLPYSVTVLVLPTR